MSAFLPFIHEIINMALLISHAEESPKSFCCFTSEFDSSAHISMHLMQSSMQHFMLVDAWMVLRCLFL